MRIILSQLYPAINYRTFLPHYHRYEQHQPQYQYNPHNRIFTREQEENIITYFKEEYIKKNITTDRMLSMACILFYQQQLHPHHLRNYSSFHASNGFIYQLKKRHHIYSGVMKLIKHVRITALHLDDRAYFFAQVHNWINMNGPRLLLCMDETPLQLLPGQYQKVLKVSKEDSNIPVSFKRSTNMTCILTISAMGAHLPIMFVPKGRTIACTRKLHCSSPHVAQYAPKGFVNSSTMIEYIHRIILPFTRSQQSALILDSHAPHFTDDVRRLCVEKDITTIRVPRNETAVYSPLDVGVNGPFKAMYAQQFRLFLLSKLTNVTPSILYAPAAQIAINTFNQISSSCIVHAFNKACNLNL